MDATTTFIADVTVALIVGSGAGAIARALRITPIVGYIIAGIIIGPFTPGYIAHGTSLSGLAELGLIFLLFSLGLGFSLHELKDAGAPALAGNILAMAGSAAAVWVLFAGFRLPHPVTLALAFTVSSTAVGAALMQTLGIARRRSGSIALSLLVTQDLAAVILLVIISTPAEALSIAGIALPLARAVVFVAVALLLGATVFHKLFVITLQRAGTELLVVIFSAVALASAWLGHLAGLTFEFGAFVAGAVTSEAAGSHMVQSVVRPFRELFVMLFFVSMGTIVDISSMASNWRIVLAAAALSIVLRWIVWTGVGRTVRIPAVGAVALGLTLLPMAEFNIVLGQASFNAGRLNRTEMAVLVGVCMLSILVSAIAARLSGERLARPERVHAKLEPLQHAATVVIIGYGRVGETAASMLRDRDIPFVIVERSVELVRRAQSAGVEAVFGDGSDPHVLSHVVSPQTCVVLTTVPDASSNAAIARWLRGRNVRSIVARASHPEEVAELVEAGASSALVPEVEGARAFGSLVLRDLGLSR